MIHKILIFGFLFFSLNIFVYADFSSLETKINNGSSEIKIKKLQNVLKEFNLYSGEIDGNYKSIETILIEYQKKSKIIQNDSDYGAGYFGEKTLKALKNDYADKFEEVTNKYLKLETPALGEKYFDTTAYYSPTKDQERYSYSIALGRYRTYEEEIQLQGEGKVGASGKEVFYGMLAAPRNYKFGTKIKLEGIGIGDVQDRGGAIDNSEDGGESIDRIDIWMGYGDEGLKRALEWGKKKIKGEIVSSNTEVTIKFNDTKSIKSNKLDNKKSLIKTKSKKINNSVVLSKREIEDLKKIKTNISKYLEKKYSGNISKKNKYKNDLVFKLQKLASKTKYKKIQAKYLYLKSIIS